MAFIFTSSSSGRGPPQAHYGRICTKQTRKTKLIIISLYWGSVVICLQNSAIDETKTNNKPTQLSLAGAGTECTFPMGER